MIDAMLNGLPPNIAFPYLDDLLIATDGSFEDHVRDIKLVFDRLVEVGATAKLSKIYVGFEEVPYLGFLVNRAGTRPNPEKTAPLREITLARLLEDPKHPARFLGMLQYYSRFIPNFANLAAPFFDARQATGAARRAILYSLRAQTSFALLMHALEHTVTLARPDWSKPFVVATDASAYGAGAVLAQLDEDGFERPIAYWSHRFTRPERAWSVPDREGWALREAVRHFRVYLLGRDFTVYTDHGSLQYLMHHQHPEDSKRQRWVAELQGYTGMAICHRPGSQNIVPDALSRLCASLHLHDVDAGPRYSGVPTLPQCEASPTLEDVPDFLPSRSFMLDLAKGPPSTFLRLRGGGGGGDDISASTLTTDTLPNVSLPSPPPPRTETLVAESDTVDTTTGVSVAFTDGHRLLVYTGDDGSQMLPGGPPRPVGATTHRAAARMHSASLTQGLTCAAITALERTPYSIKQARHWYFVCRVEGEVVSAASPRAGRFSWIGLATIKPEDMAMHSDTAMVRRLVRAYNREGISPRLELLLEQRAILPLKPPRSSDHARRLSAAFARHGDTSLGPALHDGADTAASALRALRAAVDSDPERLLVVDLEGALRVGGTLEFIQVSARHAELGPICHVFDIAMFNPPLTGEDYDTADTPVSLRAMLEDATIVKVFHHVRGDASALWYLCGLQLAGVVDTSTADMVARGSKVADSLQKVLWRWAGEHATLIHKEDVNHLGGDAWAPRPLDPKLFEYAFQDVTCLREAYLALRDHLTPLGMWELVECYSQQRCPPFSWSPSHPYSSPPTNVTTVLHDGSYMVLFEREPAVDIEAEPTLFTPSAPLAPLRPHDKFQLFIRGQARECWSTQVGLPLKPFKEVLSRIRRPVRLRDTYLAAAKTPFVLSRGALDHLANAYATHESSSCAGGVVVRRFEDVATDMSLPITLRLTAQHLAYEERVSQPAVEPSQPVQESLPTASDAEPTRAALLVRDQTHGLLIEHTKLGLTLPDVNIEVGQRAIDAALRGLHLHIGPLAEHSLSPKLHAAVMAAVNDARVLATHKGCVVLECFVKLDIPLLDYRATVFAARGIKHREEPNRTAPITTADIYPLARVMTAFRCSVLLRSALSKALTDWPPLHPAASDNGDGETVKAVPAAGASAAPEVAAGPPPSGEGLETFCTERASACPSLMMLVQEAFASYVSEDPQSDACAKDSDHPGTGSCAKDTPPRTQRVASIASPLTIVSGRGKPRADTLEAPVTLAEQFQGDSDATSEQFQGAGPPEPRDGSIPVHKSEAEESVLPSASEPELLAGSSSQVDQLLPVSSSTPSEGTQDSARVENEPPATSGDGVPGPFSAPPLPASELTTHPDDITDAVGRPVSLALPSLDMLKAAQAKDPTMRDIFEYHSKGQSREWMQAHVPAQQWARFERQAATFRLVDGLLCFMDAYSSEDAAEYQAGGKPRVYVPVAMRQLFMTAYHVASGHAGVTRTLALMSAWVWWPKMGRMVRRFVRNCHVCARTKVSHHKAGEAHRVEDGEHPWDVITIDLYSYQEVDGYDHVLVIADGFTRGVELVAFKGTPNSKQVLDALFHRVIRGHRTTPRWVRSDAGSIFISELCQEFWSAYGSVLRHSTAEHHTTAGLAERANATLHDFLIAHRISGGDNRWYLYLGHLENAFNATVNSTTGYSPTYAEFGRDPRLPLDVAFYGIHSGHACVKDYVREHLTALHAVWDTIRTRLGLNALARKLERDAHQDIKLRFEVQDRVLLRKAPGHPKWEEPYHGPYRIAEVLDQDNYRLRDLHSRMLLDTVNVDRLAPYPALTNHGDGSLAEDEQFIQRIVGRRLQPDGEGYQYKVRWRGKQAHEDSWLSLEELANCHDLVREYNVNVDPLPTPPPAPAREPLLSGTTPTPPLHVNKPSFRPRPLRDQPGDSQADSQQPPPPSQPATDPSQADHVLQPAIDADLTSFRASGVSDVRPKGHGYQALVHWHNTWAPISMLEPRRRVEVLQRLQDQGEPAAPPLSSTYADAPQIYTTVAAITGVRLGSQMPEAYVQWQPEWLAFSQLTPLLRSEARSLIPAPVALPVVDEQPASTSTPTTESSDRDAASTIQRAFRRLLASRRLWLAPASFNRPGDPRAVRIADTEYQFRFDADGVTSWLTDATLSMAQRRRCKALLSQLALPAMQSAQMA